MEESNWVDAVIQAEMDSGDPAAIAIAVASHPRFVDAIRRGLARRLAADADGPTHARIVADELKRAMGTDSVGIPSRNR